MSVRTGQAGGLRFLHQRNPQRGAAAFMCCAPQLPPAVLFGQKIGQGRKLDKKVFFVEIWKVMTLAVAFAVASAMALDMVYFFLFSVKKWARSEVGRKSQDVESSQNGLAYNGKS